MPLADVLPGRFGLAARMPSRIGDLHGPSQGVVLLPRNLAWPGMRECDVSDSPRRRAMYSMLLTQGKRNDIARLVNADLLRYDWPLIRKSLDARLGRWCERRLRLGRFADDEGAGHLGSSAVDVGDAGTGGGAVGGEATGGAGDLGGAGAGAAGLG
jgi:hypothetical protein